MENRKRMGGRIKGCKERGEWAEMYFMMLALEHGLKVSRPWGDAGRYDMGVEGKGKILRVQVKSTIYKRRGECYSLNVMGPKRKPYAPGTVDFFAILLIPIDDWYIIPFEVMGRKNCSIHFTPMSRRQKYGKYQEGWELLREETGHTIQACWDETEEAGSLRLRSGQALAALGMTKTLSTQRFSRENERSVESHVSQRRRDMGHPAKDGAPGTP